MPFEFVLLDAQSLASRAPDAVTYSDYFTDDDNYKNNDEGIVVFDNLGGDATLVAPSPRAGHEAYGHLATFVRNAPVKQIDSFWRVTGKTVESCVSDVPIWLSTAGGGVAWLHIRIDSYPKYYGHSEYRNR